jgi:peptidoglycan hydrolase FlgJ
VNTSAITGAAAAAAGETPDPRLKPAAHEFEACLMKEFLEPLQKDPLFSEEGEGASGEGSSNALMSFGSEALAKAISERGGFGIATKILEHFKPGNESHRGKGERAIS